MQKEIKDRINKRKIAYIYLLHRMFESNPAMMLKIMKIPDVTVADIQDWDLDYKEAVYKTIEEEDAKGVVLRDPDGDVPSIKSLKEKILRRCNTIIDGCPDPAKLATSYKILSEFQVHDDKKEKSVIDAINESVKPLTPKKKMVTMLEKMRQQNGQPVDPEKKRPGRPRKNPLPEEVSTVPVEGEPNGGEPEELEEEQM